MSKMIDSYNAYLKRWHTEHPNVVQPVHLEHVDLLLFVMRTPLTHVCKYWQEFGSVYRMEDGSIYEVVMRGPRPLIACFESEADWRAYDHPSTIRQYHDQW
jgi:hypothetical protein